MGDLEGASDAGGSVHTRALGTEHAPHFIFVSLKDRDFVPSFVPS